MLRAGLIQRLIHSRDYWLMLSARNSAGDASENTCIPQGMLFYEVCYAISPAVLR